LKFDDLSKNKKLKFGERKKKLKTMMICVDLIYFYTHSM